jgi:hypothetical protein
MKLTFNARLLSIICLFMFVGMVTSCKKDNVAGTSDKVELLSYGPAGVKHGEKISFIGKNLNKVTEIQMVGATVPQSAFEQQTSELIVLTVPQEAERGVVTLKTPDGDIVSKSPIDFDVPVTIKSMPASSRPGENITITGDYMNWVESVQFKDTVVTEFVSKSLTQLVIRVPMTAQTGTLIFRGGGTEPLTIETTSNLVITLPMVTSLSPNPILPEGNLTITGTDLDLTQSIVFPGASTPVTQFVSRSATQIVVKIPKETVKGKINLRAFSGVDSPSADELTVVLPSITDFAPAVVARESNLTITGTNLNLATGIVFKGVTSPVTQFVSRSATQIVVKVPKEANKGAIAVQAISGVLIESPKAMAIVGDLLPLDPLKYAFYDDAFQNNWQNWGWGNTNDVASTDNVREGAMSIKATFAGGYGAIQFNNGTVATAGYNQLTFSIFGTPGTGGKKIKVTASGGTDYMVTIEEGKWVEYKLTMAEIGNPATIKSLTMQEQGWSGTIFIDHVGFR